MKINQKTLFKALLIGTSLLAADLCLAKDASSFSDMANNLSNQFTAIGHLMTGTAYIAGIGFGISAIFKFKQHKDNPTQVPIGTPFALLAISVLLVFLPGLYKPAAESIYGTTSGIGGGFQGDGASNIPGGK